MIQGKRLTVALFALALVVAVLNVPAYGYLDPGSWSYVFQLLIAGVLGGLFAIKVYWTKVKAFFFSRFAKPKDDAKQDDQ
jgi:hypothetical protein